MRSARSIAAAIVLGIAGTAACAGAGTIYECKLKSFKRNAFVPPDVIVFLDDGNRGAMVWDGFIQLTHKAPIRAKLEQTGPKKFALSWKLENVPLKVGGKIHTQSVLRLDIGRMRASYSGYMSGLFNDDRGSGKCKVLKKK